MPEPVNEIVLSFATTAHSIAAEQALLGAGLAVKVMSLPAQIRAGCGLCLRVEPGDLPDARKALGEAAIPAQGIWRRQAEAPGMPSRYILAE